MRNVALITGACSGIGFATVTTLLAGGATVIACDINSPSATIAKQWESESVHFLHLNVEIETAIRTAVNQLADEFAGIDTLVNCAGISGWGGVNEVDLSQWQKVLNINLTGTMLMCKYVLPIMLAQGAGSIINVASIFGLEACDNNVAYNVSKGGIIQLTRSITADYASQGIRCNSVAPGLIETAMTKDIALDPQLHEKFISWHLQGRAGRADEVANVIGFLASSAASFVNGQTIAVDGGFSAGRKFAPHPM
ncbi:MAG: SDR family oxidoreductase [Gammaproteobacteria bacterium]|jgi:NAD(P)-dependent dehydrogenase (short-subunit alcohol dehydrogenase family)|nr:SDR family oxidoreductase [Zhongshania sp.]MBU0537437.1 SDR family oxidoreductase [Gammaproteobacteria bacterium]MBU1831325.1 SDR family oxidoreductase [Gammaproteobacteria bacterium]